MKNGIIVFYIFFSLFICSVTSNAAAYPAIKVLICLTAGGSSCTEAQISIISKETLINVLLLAQGDRIYPNAGIKSNNPDYSIIGCSSVYSGFCKFTASNKQPALLRVVRN